MAKRVQSEPDFVHEADVREALDFARSRLVGRKAEVFDVMRRGITRPFEIAQVLRCSRVTVWRAVRELQEVLA